MSRENPTASDSNFKGEMFLYSEPELLNAKDHGGLGVNPSAHSYAFAKSARFVPIAAAEIVPAQRHYPIVFSGLKQPTPLAIVSVLDSDNLFVDENGEWDPTAYIPGYLRCHPFALAARNDDQYSVVIDRAAPSISEDAEQPIFDGKELTAPIQARVDFCAHYNAYGNATKALGEKLEALHLLNGQQVNFDVDGSGERQSSKAYVAVDLQKLGDIDAEALREMHLDGTLTAIYAHSFSLDNWTHLLERYKERRAGG